MKPIRNRSSRPATSRREFLGGVAAGAALAASSRAPSLGAPQDGEPQPPHAATAERLIELSANIAVFTGPIHVGVVRDGSRVLLIDCGDGRVVAALREQGLKVEQVLFTHHHRDQACGALALAAAGAKLRVPADERALFADANGYWQDAKHRWHIYNQRPHHLTLIESIPVEGTVSEGDVIAWGPARVRVFATPGHTDGSVSYVVESGGKRAVFCGDLIYDEGRIWDLHSVQKGTMTTDYHGFLGDRPRLEGSLERLKLAQPDWLIPSHGRIMDRPAQAINALKARLEACYDKYVAISALRHYFPRMFDEFAGRRGHMPIRPGKPAPECLRHLGTTWMLVSKDKAALVMDCGSPRVVKWIQEQQSRGDVGKVEGLWVTHYHDDHVDAIPAFQQAFDYPCITDRHLAEVITDPLAWRLPCISPSKVRVDRATHEGESWNWHEFRLTAYHLPGQTLYHSGLLAEAGELRMFFIGDSFTMAGIDDYCPHNRTWLGRGVGFDRCLELIEKIRPTHLFNCHVDPAFDFTAEECRAMRDNLAEREQLFGQLFPWDHANFGMDEPWVRCHPYEQKSAAGAVARFDVVVTNHSAVARRAAGRAVLPGALGGKTTEWTTGEIPAKTEAPMSLAVQLPADAKPGRYAVAVDLRFGSWDLPQFTEAILVV